MSGRLRRRFHLAANPGTWKALASDARWRIEGPCPTPTLPHAREQRAAVRWPIRYQHPNAAPFVRPIKEGLGSIATLIPAEIAQPYEGIVLIEVDAGGGFRQVSIDYFDFTFVNERCAADVDTYFKFQYLRGGYIGFPNVFPGAYITSSSFLYAFSCRLRNLRQARLATADAFGRFGLRYAAPIRRLAIDRLSSDSRLEYVGGIGVTTHTQYLRDMATARVCIDMPGQGPFCYRLVECLAMGCCIIGPPHATELPVPLKDGVELVYCADDLSDLADLCVEYAHDDAKRRSMEAAAAKYFDNVLLPVKIAERYLDIVRSGA
jgi:hypothetical protein